MSDTLTSAATSPPSRPSRSWITEGLVLATVPVVGYSLALSFEHGICNYYSLPSESIQLTTWAILSFCGALVTYAAVIALYANSLGILLLNKTPLARIFGMLHPELQARWTVLATLFVFQLYSNWRHCVFPLLAILLEAFFFFVNVKARPRDRAIIDAINEAEERDLHSVRRPIEYLPKVGLHAFFWLQIVAVALWLAWTAGEGHASRQREYFCMSIDDERWAVLRIYADVAYCGAFDEATRSLTGTIRVVPLANQVLEIRSIGPLRRADPARR